MKEILLTQGKVAQIDDEDFEFINQWKWCFRQGYAIRGQFIGVIEGKKKTKTISMHRLINKTPSGMDTDHIDGDKLNNQKSNLRSCTHTQNSRNKHFYSNKRSSIYKGVAWHKGTGKWQATIKVDRKHKHIGLFKTEGAAALAYNAFAKNSFGEFAFLNEVAGR